MQGFLWAIILIMSSWAVEKPDLRSQIGSTFSSPVEYNGKFYFVATTGVLFEAEKDFKTVTKLFEGKKQTIGALLLAGDRLYWGEGIHTDKEVQLHIWDLKAKKMFKQIPFKGHIERAPALIQGQIIVPLGPGGIVALKESDLSVAWQAQTHNGKRIHIDSNSLEMGSKICAAIIYDNKGVICFDAKSGKVTQLALLNRNPKSEITTWNGHVVGMATEGDLSNPKWDIPGDLFLYNVQEDKFKMVKELRGFNFFAPLVENNFAFLTLSTGDFLLINLEDGRIHFMGEFPEPFINSPFKMGDGFCGIGIMGKYMCYTKTKSDFALAVDKRLMETVIGRISVHQGKILAPSRMGYAVVSE